jgi:hypothetical protein
MSYALHDIKRCSKLSQVSAENGEEEEEEEEEFIPGVIPGFIIDVETDLMRQA